MVQVFNRLKIGVPLVPPPVRPEPVAVVTPAMVLGKVCAALNVITPVLAMFSPVSDGLVVPAPNRRFKVAEVVVVSLPTGSACHWKV